MEEATAQELMFSLSTAEQLIILCLAMNMVLIFAFAYLIVKRKEVQETRFQRLESRTKKLLDDSKYFEERLQEIQPHRVVEKVADIKPFGMDFDENVQSAPQEDSNEAVWKYFIEDYNKLSEKLDNQELESFIGENNIRMLMYVGMMTFLPAIDIEESNYWAWKLPEEDDAYAVVPNPLKLCNETLYEDGGLSLIFASNFEPGNSYRKYKVIIPATFVTTDNGNWKLQETGKIELKKK